MTKKIFKVRNLFTTFIKELRKRVALNKMSAQK